MSQNQKLMDLECKLAFQDDTINILNDTVIAQQKQIDELMHHLQKLQAQMVSLREQQGSDPAGHELPPHY
ncbi:SlyX family protein [Pleionea mediterranea]|jgi:SlyX protein|uniref:SlyX protein n=1 Tax=Pleionea mediterranea TaxID=523701 RepID=A0A316G4C5_9GAMM|nr:SlyX family protein [Pleionea mediterranea]PWK49257.1 SlyX protein [Pleionea mediterranea]